MTAAELDRHARLEGCLLGTAIGDALLLPDEGLPSQRIRYGAPLRHRLILGRGFAAALGQPEFVSGYAGTSVLVALYAWWRHRSDLPSALTAIRACGGDVDSMGAIAGALSGMEGGVARCPPDWLWRLVDWPLSTRVLRRASTALATGGPPVRWWWPLQPLRGVLVLLIVLGHGYGRVLRRCFGQ